MRAYPRDVYSVCGACIAQVGKWPKTSFHLNNALHAVTSDSLHSTQPQIYNVYLFRVQHLDRMKLIAQPMS